MIDQDKLTELRKWCHDEFARRTTACEDGSATMREQIDWAVPEYRVRFSEAFSKAEELGIVAPVVELRLALTDAIETKK